ncbi:MAG: hypothetical protein DRN71_03945 [Candidatus Nanohalarchaeota archaeon]|nr:MAG: hypothetical protein DRN71_03945 [Candidatus Nanohaloarchaeota archaeon]
MNKRTFILFLLIAPILLASGCDGGETKTEVISTDMLVIEDIHAIPSQTVRDGDTVVIRMDVTNKGQKNVWMLVDDEDGISGNMVLVNHCEGLYDLQPDGFDIVSVSSNNKCVQPDADFTVEVSDKVLSNHACYVKFVPEQTHVFQWTITAPSNEKLHGLTNECTFNFQTIYAGIAETITYVYFAIPHEVAQRIYTKNDLTLIGDNVASYGPVVANFETGEAQPIRSGEEDTWTVYLNLKNLGSGIAKINSIELNVDEDSDFKPSVTDGNEPSVLNIVNCPLYSYYSKDYSISATDINKKLEGPIESGKSKFETYTSRPNGCGTTWTAETPDGDLNSSSGYFTWNSYRCCLNGIKDDNKFPKKCKQRSCDYSKSDLSANTCKKYLSLRNKLEIFEKESSRIGCTLTAPKDVNIMQPYKFVTRAKYAYSQERDFKIKTEPKP